MEPLYTAKTDYTPEVLERMNRKVLSRSKPFIIAIVIMAVLIVLFTAAWVHKIGAASIILGLILAAAFAGTFYFSVKSAIKKTYAYMQSNGRAHSEYRFYEDKLSEVSGAGTSEIEYKSDLRNERRLFLYVWHARHTCPAKEGMPERPRRIYRKAEKRL